MNLAALLLDIARRLPNAPAVGDDRQSWSYGQLAERAVRCAAGLRARGLVPGDRVLLSLENCGEVCELLFGWWGAGLYSLPFLLRGAQQIVLPHFDVGVILDVVRAHRRVSFFAAPTMLTRLVHAPEVAGADLAKLRTIYYGGGPMYVADLERALQ